MVTRFMSFFSLLCAFVLIVTACGGGDEAAQAPTSANLTQDEASTEPAKGLTDAADTPDTEDDSDETAPDEEKTGADGDATASADSTIRMARANWDTGWFQTEIYRQLLEEMGYDVTLSEAIAPADFYPALAQSEYDLWVNGWFPQHNANVVAQNEGTQAISLVGSQLRGGALQGYLIDKQTADAQGITNLKDLQDPAIAALFDSDGNGKADLLGCNEGWGCEAIINHHLEEYGLSDTVEHVQADYDDLMRDGLTRFDNGDPLLFYSWTPNWPVSEMPPGEAVIWLEVPYASLPADLSDQEELTLVPDLEGCSTNPCNLGFPLNDIRVAARSAFLESHPDVLRLLELVQIPLADIADQNAVMFFGEGSEADVQRQAEDWITDNRDQVDRWLGEARTWEEQPTLESVRERGELRCGIQENLPGFGLDEGGTYSGFNADFCRVVATAVFGDPNAVEFVPLTQRERFAALSDRRVDVLFHNATWNALRDVGMNPPNSDISVAFGPTIFHDGQRFMVPQDQNITNLADLAEREICVLAGSTGEQNLNEQFAARGIEFTLTRFETVDELYDTYERGGCDAVTSDTSELVGVQAEFLRPEDHVILEEQISREPHSPVYAEGDAQWADVVNWAVFVTIYAEEQGINAENVADSLDTDDPDIARLVGSRGAIGERLGLENDFALQIISEVGNYRDIYINNIDPEVLPRGPNKTWNSSEGPGGLLSAPPFR